MANPPECVLRILLFLVAPLQHHCELLMTDRPSLPSPSLPPLSLLHSCALPHLAFHRGHLLVRRRGEERRGEERVRLSWAAPCLDPALLAQYDQLGCQDSRLIIGFCVHSGGSLGSLVSGVESPVSPLIRNNDHVQLAPPPPPPSSHKPVTSLSWYF